VLTMALGIGANAAIFSVINSVLLGALPYKNPQELVMVWETDPTRGKLRNVASPPDFTDWQKQNDVFSGMSAVGDVRSNLTGRGEPEQVVVQYVSVNFFNVLGVNPIYGPGFRPENGEAGKDDVLILGNGLWKQRFAADPSIVGKTLTINGRPFVVV